MQASKFLVLGHAGWPARRASRGSDLAHLHDLGVRTWGNAGDSQTEMLTGTYNLVSEISQRLLSALPTLIVLHQRCPVVALPS